MTLSDLEATVELDSQGYSGYIESVTRDAQIAQVSVTFEILLAPDTPYDPQPWMSVVLGEMGTTVLTGFVDKVRRERQDGDKIFVSGRDRYKLAEDFYITDNELAARGETVGYWVGTLCGYCGLSYTMLSSGSSLTVGYADSEGVMLGLMTVHEALMIICAVPGWNMRMNASGVLELLLIDPPAMGEAEEIDAISGSYTQGDQDTRNVAKVWGAVSDDGSSLLYQQRIEIPLLTPDRIMLLSSQGISTLAIAQEMSDRLLTHFGNLDTVSNLSAVGNPERRVGDPVQTELRPGFPHLTILTDLKSSLSAAGYEQAMATGRKNFAMPYYPAGIVNPVEAGTPTEDDTLETVPGLARDLCIANSHVFVAGYTYSTSSIHKWRLECYHVITLEQIWAVTIEDTVISLPTTATLRDIFGVYANGTGVFIAGADGDSNNEVLRVDRRSLTDGSLVWSYTADLSVGSGSYAYAITGDGTYLYVLAVYFDGSLFQSRIIKLNNFGDLIDQVTLARNDYPAFFGAFAKNILQAQFARLRIIGEFLVVPGQYRTGSGTFEYLAKYDTNLTKVWEWVRHTIGVTGANSNIFYASYIDPVTGQIFVGGSDFSTGHLDLVKFSAEGLYLSNDNTRPLTSIDGTRDYIYTNDWHSDNHAVNGWSRASSSYVWQFTAIAQPMQIKAFAQQAKLFVCGENNGNFCLARYSV